MGAEPIAFVDYIAVPKPDPEQHAAIGASLAEACRIARVTLAGGETASLPGIVTELDLTGTALGWLPKGAAITGATIASGDVMIGLPASGVHSNGSLWFVKWLSSVDRITPTRLHLMRLTLGATLYEWGRCSDFGRSLAQSYADLC